jgi:hypothetical protein
MNTGLLREIKTRGLQAGGPQSLLVVPNPIDATQNPVASVSDSKTLQSGSLFSLSGLLNPSRLENSFLKVRVRAIGDSLSSLAAPNSKGEFTFPPQDIRYSEAMAYRSVTAIQAYVEALGFSVVKTRPLYVMVQADGSNSQEVNAFYDHAYLNPSAPRTIKLFGSSSYAPGVDQDMYWHEFGHLFNESITAERGIDYAGDAGAIWTEGSAIHECLADYLSESVSGKEYIGKWIARNISGFRPGDPLRSAVDTRSDTIDFRSVITADGTGAKPERYQVAEWCTRVLWDIRKSFVDDYGTDGAVQADRFIYSAASRLGRDTSLSEFQNVLYDTDQQLHCGGYGGVVSDAFEKRGFVQAQKLARPLTASAEAVTVRISGTSYQPATPAPGTSVIFLTRIQNSNGSTARNVRVRLDSKSSYLVPRIYQQGLGDLESGKTVSIGTSGGMSASFSVVGEIDSRTPPGTRIPYQLTILTENGSESIVTGEIRL